MACAAVLHATFTRKSKMHLWQEITSQEWPKLETPIRSKYLWGGLSFIYEKSWLLNYKFSIITVSLVKNNMPQFLKPLLKIKYLVKGLFTTIYTVLQSPEFFLGSTLAYAFAVLFLVYARGHHEKKMESNIQNFLYVNTLFLRLGL